MPLAGARSLAVVMIVARPVVARTARITTRVAARITTRVSGVARITWRPTRLLALGAVVADRADRRQLVDTRQTSTAAQEQE